MQKEGMGEKQDHLSGGIEDWQVVWGELSVRRPIKIVAATACQRFPQHCDQLQAASGLWGKNVRCRSDYCAHRQKVLRLQPNLRWTSDIKRTYVGIYHVRITLFQSILWPAASSSRASAVFQPPLLSIVSQTTPAKSLGISSVPRLRAQTLSRPKLPMK